ncbi:MAG: extracellular solute-binding protein [Vallitaleaceae bacterium]|nr:extracellular solute-binding protein [Vallitaleaceae bacterium]
MKKIVTLLLACMLVLSTVGCGKEEVKESETSTGTTTETSSGTTSSSSEKEKITVWAWDPNFNIAIMEEAKTRYAAINPNVEIEIVDMAKADVEQKLLINLSSGVTDSLPDIVLIEDYNAQKYLSAFPDSFADLTDKINYSEFAPYKVKLMTVDGKTYGIPFDSGVAGMYYRTDILEQAGFSAADLQNITWERFIEIGEVVKEKTGVAMCAFDPMDGGLVRVMLHSAGTWYYDKDGNPYLEGNAVLQKAVETYTTLINSPGTMKTSGWAEWVGAINTGSAATISTGVWITGSVKAAADQSGKWALAPIPRLDVEGSVNASNLGGSSWYILDSSKVKETAIDFMNQTFAKDQDFYQTILVNNGAVASYLPSQSGEAYVKEDEFFAGQKVFEEFAAYMNEIPEVEFGSYTYEADAAIAAILPAAMEGQDVATLLKDAQAQLESSIQ